MLSKSWKDEDADSKGQSKLGAHISHFQRKEEEELARIKELTAKLEALQSELEGARMEGKQDEIAALVRRAQDCEALALHRNALVLSMASKIDDLGTSRIQGESETASMLQDRMKRSEIQIKEKDAEITFLRQRIQGHVDVAFQLAEDRFLGLASSGSIDERARDDGKAEGEPTKQCEEVTMPKEKKRHHHEQQAAMGVDNLGSSSETNEGQAEALGEEVESQNETVDTLKKTLAERNEALSSLSRRILETESARRSQEREVALLSKMDGERKARIVELESQQRDLRSKIKMEQERRTADMEAQRRILRARCDGLTEEQGKQDKARQEIRRLQQALNETNDLVARLEGEAVSKDRELVSLSKARQDLLIRVTQLEHEKGRSELQAKEKAEADSQPSKTRLLRRLTHRPDESDASQLHLQYEQRIAELSERLAECHGLLKAGGMRGPGAALNPAFWSPRFNDESSRTAKSIFTI